MLVSIKLTQTTLSLFNHIYHLPLDLVAEKEFAVGCGVRSHYPLMKSTEISLHTKYQQKC